MYCIVLYRSQKNDWHPLGIPMGDKIEPRREFIEKHALEVKNLDV
jgi:DNA gyrase/topoisomerase IV subunit B